MRQIILTVGDIVLEEERYNSDIIGGMIYGTNTKTGQIYDRKWHKKHGGKNDRWLIMAECVEALAPKAEEDKDGSELNESIITDTQQ